MPFLALRSLCIVWFFLLRSYWLGFLLLSEGRKQNGKSVLIKNLRQKQGKEEESNETWLQKSLDLVQVEAQEQEKLPWAALRSLY